MEVSFIEILRSRVLYPLFSLLFGRFSAEIASTTLSFRGVCVHHVSSATCSRFPASAFVGRPLSPYLCSSFEKKKVLRVARCARACRGVLSRASPSPTEVHRLPFVCTPAGNGGGAGVLHGFAFPGSRPGSSSCGPARRRRRRALPSPLSCPSFLPRIFFLFLPISLSLRLPSPCVVVLLSPHQLRRAAVLVAFYGGSVRRLLRFASGVVCFFCSAFRARFVMPFERIVSSHCGLILSYLSLAY